MEVAEAVAEDADVTKLTCSFQGGGGVGAWRRPQVGSRMRLRSAMATEALAVPRTSDGVTLPLDQGRMGYAPRPSLTS